MNDLERELVLVGRELDVPAFPDLAPRVLASLERGRRPWRRGRLVLALAALALAALLAALAIPDARSALLRFLQIGGVRIELVDELPAVIPNQPDLELVLGQRVSLEAARRSAKLGLLELEEEPDAVYLGDRDTVWFLYGRPDAVRLLVAQTSGVEVDEAFLIKKLAAAGTSVEGTEVHGAPAYFVSGEPHAVLLVDEDGNEFAETAWLARDVLVWEVDGRTMRLEGDLTLGEARELAESLR